MTKSLLLGNKRQIDQVIDEDDNVDQDVDHIGEKRFKKDNKIIENIKIIKEQEKVNEEQEEEEEGITITSFNGFKIFRSFKQSKEVEKEVETEEYYSKENILKRINDKKLNGKLLKQSIEELQQEIQDSDLNKFKQVKQNLLSPSKNNKKISTTTTNDTDNRLWVDKYSPTSFHELLSDDKMNKDILYWLKQWDGIVFGKKVPTIKNQDNNNHNNSNTTTHFFHQTTNSKGVKLDQDYGPQHKVILLTGGPGLGKTTLAHILAKQAGYNPIEINASEDRSGEQFENKFIGALEMKSVFGDKKPNCLIIDEIDGISGRDNGPIELILKMIANDRKSRLTKAKSTTTTIDDQDDDDGNDDGDDDYDNYQDHDGDNHGNSPDRLKSRGAKNNKTKKSLPKINRPIICICNDQYVPSLRRLRQEVLLFNFVKPKQTRLVSRLKEICLKENLKADDSALNMLVELTNSDIRSCLNNLQCLRATTSTLTINTFKDKKNIIAQKDMEKGLFDLWKGIFTTPKSSSTSSLSSNTIEQMEELESLEQQISSCNQSDKLIEGLFENYLLNMTNDFNLEKSNECIDWFIYQDFIKDEKFKLTSPMAIHKLCNNYAPKITYPNSDYTCFIKQKQVIHTIDSFIGTESTPPQVYSGITKKAIITDFISPFLEILSVPLRTVNPQLYSQKEKTTLNNLVQTMKYYHISYQIENNNNSQLQYNLNPPIDILSQFIIDQDIKSNSKKINLNTQQKQIIQNALTTKVVEKPKPKLETKPTVVSPFKIPNATPKKDFFGREIQNSPEHTSISKKESTAPATIKVENDIKYRFQEGFTNAVKKVVHMKDFF